MFSSYQHKTVPEVDLLGIDTALLSFPTSEGNRTFSSFAIENILGRNCSSSYVTCAIQQRPSSNGTSLVTETDKDKAKGINCHSEKVHIGEMAKACYTTTTITYSTVPAAPASAWRESEFEKKNSGRDDIQDSRLTSSLSLISKCMNTHRFNDILDKTPKEGMLISRVS